jgi:hypothetical protein
VGLSFSKTECTELQYLLLLSTHACLHALSCTDQRSCSPTRRCWTICCCCSTAAT